MLKTTLKAPKTDKKTKVIIGMCNSVDDLSAAILSFWDREAVSGSSYSFILDRLSALSLKTTASESDITAFTNLASAVLGKTFTAAKKELGYGKSIFLTKAGEITRVHPLAIENQKIWRFMFVTGDFFRVRSVALEWKSAKSPEERDAAALRMREMLYPIMVDNIKFKFPAISAVMSRIGDLLNDQMFNIFQMLRVGTEEPASQTLTSESASDAYQQRKTTGADFLRSMSIPGRIEEAKAEIANMLDSKNPESLEWINVRNLFGERAEAVRTALLSGKFGFGSPGEQDGCANFINSGPSHGAEWLKDVIQTSIQKVIPQVEQIREELLNDAEITDEQAEEWIAGIKVSRALISEYDIYSGAEGSFLRDLKAVFKLARGRIRTLKNIDILRGRSFANIQKKQIALNPRGGKRALWHEVGHHFEFSNPDYLLMARAYLAERTNGENAAVASLNRFYRNGVYGDKEVAIADHLSSPYIGKIYGGYHIDTATFTEVFSSGFEYLAQPNSGAISLVNSDGLIEFVTGVLKEGH
ncbi:hypothetical protein ACIEGK_27820 [Citrobacter freundii]|uniref:hypothetical protein n=1 Tax=Citrobacter freundii complex TaxID=1344959 RepID=UPI0021127D41|nr:hypothetical protein [Citrobacter portucalensis]MCQ6311675.1 hypothetical protein [Citrobacter portucalensis]